MKRIKIDNKEYTFKFSVRASLYNECIETILDAFISTGRVQGSAEARDLDGVIDGVVSTISNIPQKALTLFYAGLIECHGTGRNGDGSIESIDDANDLLVTYIEENIGEDGKPAVTMAGVFKQMMEIVGDDNFFEIAGINETIEQMTGPAPKKKRKSKSGEK